MCVCVCVVGWAGEGVNWLGNTEDTSRYCEPERGRSNAAVDHTSTTVFGSARLISSLVISRLIWSVRIRCLSPHSVCRMMAALVCSTVSTNCAVNS